MKTIALALLFTLSLMAQQPPQGGGVQPNGIMMQAQQAGAILAGSTRNQGLWAINCSAVLSCTWAGSTLTINFAAGGGAITGSGTANILPKFTAAAVIGNSSVHDDGTQVYTSENVGIGTATPAAPLDIKGDAAGDYTIYLRESGIAHGMTNIVPTDVYAAVSPYDVTGGLTMAGFSVGDAYATQFKGVIGSATPSATTPALYFQGQKRNGAGVQNLGATDLLFAVNNGNSAFLMTMLGSGNVGIGTAVPATELQVLSTSAADPRGIMTAQYTTDALGARLHFRKARGTEGTPTVVATADLLGRMRFSGYDGANFLQMATIDVGVSGTVASTRVPTYMAFSTATDAAPSVLTERMRILNNGNVGIGTATPTYTLQVQPSAGGTVAQTAFFQDATATTGKTTVLIKGGAGQTTTSLLTLQDTSANLLGDFFIQGGLAKFRIGSGTGGAEFLGGTAGGVQVSSGSLYCLTSSSDPNGTPDSCISRISAGVLGVGTGAAGSVAGTIQSGAYATGTNCADSAGAAACGSAAAGAFVIDAAATTVVVSTTAVTANSEIFVQEDSSLGTRLGITCNTQSSLVIGSPVVTARTAGASFTVAVVVGPTAVPACFNYHIIN